MLITASVHFPVNGAWSGELALGDETAPALGSVLAFELEAPSGESPLACRGRVVRSGLFADRVAVRVTGGEQDWSAAQPVKHYHNTTVAKVAADVGVTISDNTALPFWTRNPGTTASTIEALARQVGVTWRVQPDGTVFFGVEEFELVDPGGVEVARDDARGLVTLAVEIPSVLPGVALPNGEHTGDVLYDFSATGLRVRYYTEARARLRGSLERLIRWVMRDTLYHGQYTCQVMAQQSDGTLDLLPDDARLRAEGLQSVPIRHGLPGCEVEVPAGERVLLGFDGGDPSKPYAALWHAGQVAAVRIGGTIPVALSSGVEGALGDFITATKTVIAAAVDPTGIPAAAKTAFATAAAAVEAQISAGVIKSEKLFTE